ncbi:MAG: glycosyltransferase family 2 protein [Gemmataceae bacterium]|nr:glycosyltransferase family 2 protein [Gemmataceae bacterium]MDW8263883.1 glycosyltransferase family A protein [Gemmataceae bacterium]
MSVLLANYNHAAYVGDAIRAILAQNYRDFELIVIDDGSTDNSREVIAAAVGGDPRAMVIHNERNLGLFASIERGLKLASGEFLYWAAADDLILVDFFEKTMALLEAHPQAGLCCSDPAQLDDRTSAVYPLPLYWSEGPDYLSPDDLAAVMCGGSIYGNTTIVRRSAWQEAGGLHPQLRWHADWFVNLVIAARHGICYIPESLALMRVRPESYSNAGRQNWDEQKQVLTCLIELLRSPAYRDVVPFFAWSSALSHFDEGCQLVRLVMERPEWWDPATLMLIQEPLANWCLKMRNIAEARLQRVQANLNHNRRWLTVAPPTAKPSAPAGPQNNSSSPAT